MILANTIDMGSNIGDLEKIKPTVVVKVDMIKANDNFIFYISIK